MVPFLGTLNIRGRTIMGAQKRTIILTTTHMSHNLNSLKGDILGIMWGPTIGDIRGDTRSQKFL